MLLDQGVLLYLHMHQTLFYSYFCSQCDAAADLRTARTEDLRRRQLEGERDAQARGV